jgi:hypothetical protein
MNKILTDFPDKKYYKFIRDCYPWNWGSYELFLWKHSMDPFRSKRDFYYIKNAADVVVALCVGRVYEFFFAGHSLNVLSMMDFATAKKYRNTGLMSELSGYIVNNNVFDMSLGFSSEYLYQNVYSHLCCFQTYHTYEFSNTENYELSEEIYDTHKIADYLNNCQNALRIKMYPEYIQYISCSPKFGRIIYLEKDGLLISVGFQADYAQILDISQYTADSCLKAVRMAGKYFKNVRIDMPHKLWEIEKTKNSTVRQIRTICCISDKVNDIVNINGDETIWIPVMDRR